MHPVEGRGVESSSKRFVKSSNRDVVVLTKLAFRLLYICFVRIACEIGVSKLVVGLLPSIKGVTPKLVVRSMKGGQSNRNTLY